jgi:hypothetical protein
MDALKRFIHEVHRRSLWQVLAIYLVGSWGARQAVQGITQAAGLPDWVPPGALILLLLGLRSCWRPRSCRRGSEAIG